MSTGRKLLAEFFDCLQKLNTSVDRCVALFAEDGVFEFPYMPTIGIEARFQGHEAIRGVLELIRSHFPSFTLSNIEIHDLKDGSGLFVEYHSQKLRRWWGQGVRTGLRQPSRRRERQDQALARVSQHHFERSGLAAQRPCRRASAHELSPKQLPPTWGRCRLRRLPCRAWESTRSRITGRLTLCLRPARSPPPRQSWRGGSSPSPPSAPSRARASDPAP